MNLNIRAGEPSSAKSLSSNILITFCLCNLMIQFFNDEDFTQSFLCGEE
jgi:hypothetical protein